MARTSNPEMRDAAIKAIGDWRAAQDASRQAEVRAMQAIAALPGKSITFEKRRYVAVTSRRQVDIRRP